MATQAVREVTVWDAEIQPNHDYLLEGDRVLAYRPWHGENIVWLSGTLKLDRRGRKFQPLDDSVFGPRQESESSVVKVPGSKGNVYLVDTEAKTCTCPGFQFRSNCRHLKEV